ncbi:MAG: hypothetical protein AB8B94_16825 [Hyphomicrobiales bacterium]
MYQQDGASCWGAARWAIFVFAGALLVFFLVGNPETRTASAPGAIASQ